LALAEPKYVYIGYGAKIMINDDTNNENGADNGANDNANTNAPTPETPAEQPPTEAKSVDPVADAPVNPPTAPEAAPTEPVNPEPAPEAPEPIPAPAVNTIKVALEGELDATYEGPAGKTLTEMFPKLGGGKKYQVRNAGQIVAQDKAWTDTATLKVVAHAKHG
jgi:hypothetical protein